MTDQELIDYYVDLLIIQYHGKPKARASIAALIAPIIMNQLPLVVQNGFNLTDAVGVQLDTLGQYAGVTRTGNTFTGQITLNDDEFRILITLAIIKNSAGSSLYAIQELLANYFAGTIFVFDFSTMRMGYYISSNIASQNLAQMFISKNLLPVPMGVQLSTTVYAPVLDKFYGFVSCEIQTQNNSPLNTAEDYQMDRPWLNAEYGIGNPSSFDDRLTTEDGDILVQEDGSLIYT